MFVHVPSVFAWQLLLQILNAVKSLVKSCNYQQPTILNNDVPGIVIYTGIQFYVTIIVSTVVPYTAKVSSGSYIC